MASLKKIDFVQAHYGGGYGSEDDFARRVPPLPHASSSSTAPARAEPAAATSRQAPIGRLWGQEMRSLNAYERHVRMMAMYESHYKAASSSSSSAPRAREITDMDLLASEHRFVMSDDELKDRSTPEKRMALFYYTKLFKEYCLADLSQYRDGRVGLRWRTESEVKAGKGQFSCGNKRCASQEQLRSYEVNFAYSDTAGGAPKSALVKIRLCPPCAYKMHYPKIKEAQRTARAALRAQRTRDRTERQSAKERRHQEKRTGKSRPQAIVLAPDASSSAGVAQSASGSGSRTGDSDSSSASASEGEDASDSSSSDDESTVVAALVGSKRKSVESESTRKSSRADQIVKILQRFERPSHSSSTGAEDPLASHAPASSASSSSSAPMRRPAADAAPSDSFSAGLRAAQRFNASQRASSASSSTAASAASSLTPQAGRADGASASEAEEWAKFEEKLMASLFV